MRGFSLGWVLGVGSIVILAGLVGGFFWYQSVLANGLVSSLPHEGGAVVFTETGMTEKYMLSHSDYSLLLEPAIHHNDAVILEKKEVPGTSEEVVLAKMPGTPGVTVALVHSNGNLEPIVSDGTYKTDLQVTGTGLAVFAVNTDPVSWGGEHTVPSENPEESVPDGEGRADGPLPSSVPYVTAPSLQMTATSLLFVVNLTDKNHEVRLLGEGKSPRRRADDSIIALTAQGISKIDPNTGTGSVLLPYLYGNAVGSTISADGVTAVMRTNGNSLLDVYRISGDQVTNTGSVVSRDMIYGASFADGAHLFIRTSINSAAVYELTDAVGYPLSPTTHLALSVAQ